MKNKHYDLIMAWADGAEIEYEHSVSHWVVTPTPNWSTNTEYRVKPKPNKELSAYVSFDHVLTEPSVASIYLYQTFEPDAKPNIKFTFDGGTGEFLKVEKI